ncbi:MAG: sugar transferase [Lachnospiraceae bacterium]|nr:sugar transferase [Lachnospiraceae bacterium]
MYKRNNTSWLKHGDFMLIDFILFQVSFLISYVIRNGFQSPYDKGVYQSSAIVLALMNVCIGFFIENYKGILRRGYWREFRAVVNQVMLVTFAIISYLFAIKASSEFSRIMMLCFPVISILLLYCGRIAWKFFLKKYKRPAFGKRSIFLIGTFEDCRTMFTVFQNNPYSEFQVAGIGILDQVGAGEIFRQDMPVLSGEDAILKFLQANWVDEVLFHATNEMSGAGLLIEKCKMMGITVHIKLAGLEHGDVNQIVEKLEGYTVLTVSMMFATDRQMFLKRVMDITGGIVGLILTGIITIIIGPIIYIKSPGPIFFSQVRVGKNGRKFRIYKFRSMYIDAEERKRELIGENNIKGGMMFKVNDDPRIIKGIGHFMRRYSLDEFPQFWNVLKGEMSLVGTRPPTVDEWEKYEYHHRSRLAIKPGMTGLWQVSGRSRITDFEEVVKLDRKYIQNWNIGQDIKILLKTVRVVLKKDGSM